MTFLFRFCEFHVLERFLLFSLTSTELIFLLTWRLLFPVWLVAWTFHFFNRYCNSHLQVLGIVPKKNRRKKPCETGENEVNSSSSTCESTLRTDVLTSPCSSNMSSLPPQIFPVRLKKPKTQPMKRSYTNIPAIEELRDGRKKWRKDRADLFSIYGKNFHDFPSILVVVSLRHVISCFCTE